MSAEKMREEFEASYLRGDFYAAEQDSEVRFQDFRKHCAYVAFKTGWQASRAAIEVELPESVSIHNTEVIKAVGRHIIAQGLKVKQ